MSKRHQAREFALQIIYQIEQPGQKPDETMSLFWSELTVDQEVKKFAEHLVKGVCDNLDQIDEKIAHHSTHWKLDRMTRIDRSLLRLAAFEMFWCEDIPGKVAINEAIELGKKYGTEESSSFLNGVLDALYKEKER